MFSLTRISSFVAVLFFVPQAGIAADVAGAPQPCKTFTHAWEGIPSGQSSEPSDSDRVYVVQREQRVFQSGDRKDRIVVEAEHFASQEKTERRKWYVLRASDSLPELEGAGDAEKWIHGDSSAAKTASGKCFLRLLPDTRRTHDDPLIRGENFSPEPGKMAIVSYEIDFDSPGRYYVWVRAFSTGSEDNGIHVGIDGQWPEHGQRMQWCQGKHQWTWGCAQRTAQQHCGVPMEIYLDVDEPGQHTISFSMREDGFAFDQFMLTKDPKDRPTGIELGERIRSTLPGE